MEGSRLRLLHFADLHLGVQSGGRIDPATGLNQRIVDVCDRLDEVCATVEAERVHAVLFAGDAFNNQHPNPTLQSLFASRVRRLTRAGASVFLLIGNHDLPRRRGVDHPFSIYESLEVEGVVVGDRARIYHLPLRDAPAPALQIAALPHFSRAQVVANEGTDVDIERALAHRIHQLGTEIERDAPAVFVGHCQVNQAEVGHGRGGYDMSEIEMPLSSLTSGQPYPYFALGHMHKHQVLSGDPFVAYPGSLERVDFGEGDQIDVQPNGAVRVREGPSKGFFRFDYDPHDWSLSSEPDFRTVAARRFITVQYDDVDTVDPMADIGRRTASITSAGVDWRDALVRITGTVTSADRGRIPIAAVRALFPDAYDVSLALETTRVSSVRDPRFAVRMNEIDALDRYLETRDDWQDDGAELRRLGHELIREVLDA